MKDNHKYLKRFLAFALSVAMVITYMPVNLIAYAENEAPVQPVAEEEVDDAANTEAPAPQDEVTTEEPAPVQEEVAEPAPAPVEEEPAVTEEQVPAEEEQQVEEPAEETPVEETAEPEKEETFPAQTFNADKGGVKVLVKAPEGALPEGTEMVVTPANTKAVEQAVKDAVDGEVTGFKAVDITFVKDGEDVEPKVPVHVYLNASGLDNANAVVHIPDNGSAEVVDDATVNKAGIAKVVTDQFSVYVVVETGADARLKVNFHQFGGNVVTMMITQNQISQIEKYIFDPGAGTVPEGAQFRGWTDKENYTTDDLENEMTIADVRDAVKAELAKNPKDGDEIDFYPMAFKSYTVTYLDEEGVTLKNDQKIYALSDTAAHNYEVNLSYIPYVKPEYESLGVSAEFAGWEDKSASKVYKNGDSFTINKDVTLQAKVDTGYWITYSDNLKGASYTQPEFVKAGEKATKPSDPTRTGYDFEAWYTEDAGPDRDGQVAGEEFDFTKPLTKTTIVYGKWNKNAKAKYNVVIWQQSAAGGDKYDYAETIEVSNANVGENTYPINASGTGNARIAVVNTSASASRNVSYFGFHLSTTKGTNGNGYDKPATVAAENNTVINVYFDRNTITYNFDNGESYSGLYGAPFTQWPDPGNGYTWYRNRIYYPLPLTEFKPENVDTNPGTTTTFTFQKVNYRTGYTLTVYKEDVNGTWVYDSAHTMATARLGGGTWYPTETYTGYTLDAYRIGNGRWNSITPSDSIEYNNNFALRYKRNVHDINYRDGVYTVYTDGSYAPIEETKLPDSYFTNATDIRYEADITDKGNYTPTRDGYVFLGWYADEACLAEYDFDKMPDNNVTVYAKWVAAELTVELHPNAEGVRFTDPNQPLKFHSDYGEKVGNPGASHEAFDLVGWYSDEALTKTFDFSVFELNDTTIGKYGDPTYREANRKSVVGKIDLYAKWRSKLDGSKGIEIEYVPGEGTLTEEDDNYYVDQAEAIAVAAATSNNEDKVFSHWVVQKWNGSSYEPTDEKLFPGETFTVRKDYAQRIDIPESEQTEEGIDKRFVVQLKAEYVEKDKEIKTFINWYNNYDGGKVATSENLKINEATPIPAAPTRTGYEFKGWIRGIEEDGPTTTLTDLWLTYEDGAYTSNGKPATQVAADELLVGDGTQHHALYAKWEAQQADYTVEFYYQNDNGEGYTKDESLTSVRKDKKTDETASATAADKAQTKNDKYKFVKGDPESATVAGDGSTVLKLYFDLNKVDVTVEHYLKGQTNPFKTEKVEGQIVGSTYTATPETTYQSKNLTVDSKDPESGAITVNADKTKNIVKIYYTLPLTITAKTDSKPYDGTALNGEYTVEGALDADEASIKASLGTAPSITNVADGPKEYQAATTGIPEYYEVTNNKGTLTINPAPVTITAQDKAFTYTGEAQSWPEYDVDGLVGTDAIEAVVEGSITFPSQSPVANEVKSYKFTKGTASNYSVTTVDGELTMTNAEAAITITAATEEWTYDGKAHQNTEVTVTAGKLFAGDKLVATASGSVTNVADTAAGNNPVASGYKVMHGTEDVTANYAITAVAGKLTINPKELTITADSDSKSYNGEALTKDSFTNTALAEGDEIDSVTVTGSQTLVGSSANVASDAKIVNAKGDATANYTIKYVDGTLTVTDKNVPDNKVVNKTDGEEEKTYNLGDTVEWTITVTNIYAEEKSLTVEEQDGVEIKEVVPKTLKAGETLTLTATHTITAADVAEGSYTNTVNVKLGDLEKKDDDTVETATLAIEITAASDKKVYDAEPLTNDGYELSDGELVSGDEIVSVKVEGSQTLVGSSKNVASEAKIVNAAGEDVTAGYAITYVDGTLTVTDGTNPGEDPVDPDKVVTKTDKNTGKKYHVGDTVTWTIWVKNIYDEEKTLTVTEQEGVTITDPNPVPETLKAGDEITLTATHIITAEEVAAGSYKNTVTVKLGDLEKKGDDEVKTEPIKISITAASDKKVYDATPLTNDGYEQTAGELAEGHKIDSVKVDGSQTLVGSSPNKASDAKIVDADGKDVTAGYDITYVDGTLTVTDGTNPGEDPVDPDKVVKKTDDNTGKTYHVGDTVTWTIWVKNIYDEEKTLTVTEKEGVTLSEYPKTLKAGEEVEITATHVITGPEAEAGSYKNEVTAKLGDLEKPGEDTVKTEQLDIEITAGSGNKVYDGTALTNNEYELSKGTLVDGDKIDSVQFAGSQTDAGESKNVASNAKIVNAAGEDVTKGYNITYVDGTLTVTKRPVTITSESAEKSYDGTPLTKHAVIVSEGTDEGFAPGEGLEAVNVTGSQTLVGSSENTFEYKLFGDSIFRKLMSKFDTDSYDPAANGVTKKTKAENYDITVKYGTLKVTDDVKPEDLDSVTTKTHEGKEYKLGDTVKFTIEATNIYDEPKTITVEEQEGVTITSESKFENVEPGAKVTVTAEYVVTEADIIAGEFKNQATVTIGDKPFKPEDTVDVEDSNPHLTVVKETTSTPANGKSYEVGETVTYEITVTNDGNLTVKDIEVKDDLTGDAWNIESLAPDKSQTFNCEYTVTEEDAKNGSVTNIATATGTTDDPNHPYPTVVPGEKTVPVAEPEAEPTTGVKTGDDTNIPGMVGGFFASVAALFGALFIRRRRSDEE